MNKSTKNKINYILLRYKIDSKDLSLTLRLELLKRWIESCVEAEEYEMASALKKKRNEIIKSIRLARKGNKHFVDNWFIKLKWNLRKIKNFFLSKLF